MLFATLTACLLCIDTAGGFSLHLLTAPLLTSLVICWPTSFLPRKFRYPVQIIIGEFVVLLCLVDAYCLTFFNSSISPQLYQTVILTDNREAAEFLRFFIGWNILLEWRIMYLLALAIIYPLLYLPWLWTVPVIVKIRSVHLNKRKTHIVVLTTIVATLVFEAIPTWHYLSLFFPNTSLADTEGLIFRKYHQEVPTPLHRIVFAIHATEKSKQTLRDIKAATFSATVECAECTVPHIILIIGESCNKHHSTLYGYPLPTTPHQQQRMDDGELILFTDAVTPWNITSNVLLCMLSTDGIGSPLSPILFRRAGYNVRFFSNQYFLRTPFEGATNQAGHFFLSDRQLSDSIFNYRNGKSSKYDMGLVQQLRDFHNDHHDSLTLDIVHLIGQHFDYAERYPHDKSRFTAADYCHRKLSDKAREEVMHYDNATLYNDLVLDSIVTLYIDEDAIVFFLSDHGEEIYDNMSVRGRQFGVPTTAIARNEFEVPMWVWCSPHFRKTHPHFLSYIQSIADAPFYTADLSQLLLNLIGVRYHPKKKHQQSRRIIEGGVDYDELM